MRENKKDGGSCEILPVDAYLQHREFNIWDCYSEHSSSYNDRLHFHNFYELTVIYEGTSRFLVNGASFSMGRRSLQLIRPSDYHRQLTGEGEHIRYYNLMFSAAFLSEPLLELLEENQEPLCAVANPGDWEDLLKLVRHIFAEFTRDPEDALGQILIRSGVETLCAFLLRNQKSAERSQSDLPQEAIRRAISYLQKNYRSPIRLADAAGVAGLSPSYFSSVFHRAMGLSFSAYLTGFRLQTAERYLSCSDLSVKQIASLCGFSSYPHFVTAFRAQFGLPPGAFRKRACRRA